MQKLYAVLVVAGTVVSILFSLDSSLPDLLLRKDFMFTCLLILNDLQALG